MSRAAFETLWHTHPERFDRKRTSLGRHLFSKLAAALPQNLASLSVADLGCGKGEISLLCQSRGATIDAVDIADNALKHLENQPAINPLRQALPHTTLRDQHYDIVCCIDLIATLSKKDNRLSLSEIPRI
ncbi:MAG: methyltransferase domain-containing protein, partial [Chlamydiia bacterium]|nr:methyltransferase domain-containing protein [Chlamydiia bacterium]